MELEDGFLSLVSDPSTPIGELSYSRKIPPADFLLTLEGFSSLKADLRVESYESGIFETAGYKWRLCIYPQGDSNRGGAGHVSVYLILVEAMHNFPVDWQVSVNFKLFIHDQIRDEYITMQGLNKCFCRGITQHCFPKFVALVALRNQSTGFLINDTCKFGAEIFVLRKDNKRQHQCVTLHKFTDSLPDPLMHLKNFSKLTEECYHSDVFCLGGKKWEFIVYPKGDSLNRGKLSVHLQIVEPKTSYSFGSKLMRMIRKDKQETGMVEIFPHGEALLVEFIIELVDQQKAGRSHFRTVLHKFDNNWNTSNTTIKCGDMLCLSHLMDDADSFLKDDVLCLSAQFYVFGEARNT